MKRYSFFLIILSGVFVFSSCTQKIYKEYNLFQKGLDSLKDYTYKEPIIQNNDRLNIKIFSATLSQDQAMVFNIASGGAASGGGATSAGGGGNVGGSTTTGSTSNGATTSGSPGGYLVDFNGNISLPIIGKIKCAGLTIAKLDSLLSEKLDSIIKDPVVTISFANFKVNILGEVKTPGTKSFSTPNPTILDLLSQAGDFTDRAKRNEVYLIREINGKRTTYKINFNEVSLFNNEVYQLVQNDFVYVPADDIKLKVVNQDPDLQKKLQITQMTLTAISALAVIINTFFLLKKL